MHVEVEGFMRACVVSCYGRYCTCFVLAVVNATAAHCFALVSLALSTGPAICCGFLRKRRCSEILIRPLVIATGAKAALVAPVSLIGVRLNVTSSVDS